MSNPTKNPKFDSVQNSTLDDGVDYLDPTWLALTPSNIETFNWSVTDITNPGTSGSGIVDQNNDKTRLITGGTQDSHARATRPNRWRLPFDAIAANTTVQFVNQPERFAFGVVRTPGTFADADNSNHVGFEYDGGDAKIVWKTDSDASQQVENQGAWSPDAQTIINILLDKSGIHIFDGPTLLGETTTVDKSDFEGVWVRYIEVYHGNPDSASDNRVDVHQGTRVWRPS